MKKILRTTFLIFSVCFIPGFTLLGQGDLYQLWDQDEIICKEQEMHEAHFHQPFSRNEFANQTDIHYQTMAWEIDPAVKYIKGEITYYFSSQTPNLTQLILDLSDSLQVNNVTRGGVPLFYTHDADQLLRIDLDKTLDVDEYDTLTVNYEGIPPSNGFGSFEQGTHSGEPIIWTLSEPYGNRDWWPGKQDLIDKVDSVDIFITTPIGKLAASNGKLMSIEEIGGKLVHHWRHRHPIVGYLIALAVTNYAAYSQYVPLPNGDSIEILNYVYPETLTQSMEATQSSVDIMKFFNEKFITYPFADEKYGHAQFGWGGGEEHQTMSFMGGFSFGLQAHEMAHQWFGDKVTCGTWEDIWLNEGFATYLTGLTYEQFSPNQFWLTWKNSTSNSATSQPGGSVFVDDTTNVGRIFNGRLSYNKGAYLLHMLRWKMGDFDFFQGVINYLNGAGDFGTTAELQGFLEAQSGIDLDEFIADWFYGQGYPSYDLKWSTHADSLIFNLSQITSHASVSFFEMPVPILARLDGVDFIFRVDHTTNNQRFAFNIGSASVDSIGIDPDRWLLSRNNTIQQVTTATSDPDQSGQYVIYPNPARSSVQILSPEPVSYVELMDVTGKRIPAEINNNRIDVSHLSPGIYSLFIKNAEGKILGIKRVLISQ